MNIYQKKVVILLDEVIDICNRGNIPWFLSGRTGMRLYNGTLFTKGLIDTELAIPISKVEVFLNIFKNMQYSNRVVESLNNNSNFAGLYFKYIATDSSLIRINDGKVNKYPGLFVKIVFVKNKPLVKSKLLLGRHLLALISDSAPQYVEFTGKTFFVERVVFKFLRTTCRTLFTRLLFKYLVNLYSSNSDGEVIVDSIWGSDIFFDKGFFAELNAIIWENRIYQIPEEAEKYFFAISDDDWDFHSTEIILEGRQGTIIVEGANNIASTFIPYNRLNQLLFQKGLNTVLFRKRKKEIKKKFCHKNMSELSTETWNLAQRAGDLWDIFDIYSERKKLIIKLFSVRQLDKLRDVLAVYDQKVHKYEKLKMGFYYDNDIWEIYLYILKEYKENKFAEKVSHLAKRDKFLQQQLQMIDSILKVGEEL